MVFTKRTYSIYRKVIIYGSGTFAVLLAIISATGLVDIATSGDITCGRDCISYFNITTSNYSLCFGSTFKGAYLEGNATFDIYKADLRYGVNNPNRWKLFNLTKGVCLDRGKTFEFKIVGHKKPEQTVKWGIEYGSKNIDPIWKGESSTTTYGSGYSITTNPDGSKSYTEGVQTFETYNSTLFGSPFSAITQDGSNYSIVWLGGGLKLIWDGTYAYDQIYNPDTNETLSYWNFWHVESWKSTGQGSWQEEIPVSNTFEKISDNEIIRHIGLASGGNLSIVYYLNDKLKYSVSVTAGYNRAYRLKYRVDSIPSDGSLNNESKRFNAAFFNMSMIYDFSDIPPYRADNRSHLDMNGTYIYDNTIYISGYNVTSDLSQSNHQFLQYIYLGNMNIGNTTSIDPTWTVGNNSGNSWNGNVTLSNTRIHNDQWVWLDNNITNWVSYWDFEEGRFSGSTKSYDVNLTSGNNGTLTNMNNTGNNMNGSRPSGWTTGKYGNGLGFDGANDYVEIVRKPNLEPKINMTLEAWISTNSSLEQYFIGRKTFSSETSGYLFGTLTGSIILNIGNGSAGTDVFSNGVNFLNNTFYHVAATYANGNITFYKNGINIGTGYVKPPINYTALQNVYIGVSGPGAYPFNGKVDEVRIYNRTLSQSEIAIEYNKTFRQKGNITSVGKDAQLIGSAGDVWKNITFMGANTSMTNISIWINSSADAITWSNWSALSTPAISGTNYTLAAGDQKRYVSWRLVLNGNLSATPNIYNVTMTSASGADTTPPTFSLNSTNSTANGTTIMHSLLWADNTALSGYIFSFDNGTGTFVNNTWTAFGATGWANVSKGVNITSGTIIRWKQYANDTNNNKNTSSIFNYILFGNSCSCPAVNTNWVINLADYCIIISTCDISTGNISFTGNGNVTCNTAINTSNTNFSYILQSSLRQAIIGTNCNSWRKP